MRLPHPAQDMIRRHIEEPAFVGFFVSHGGGFDPTGFDLRPDECVTSADSLRIRAGLLDKLLRYVIAYQAGLPPACSRMSKVMESVSC